MSNLFSVANALRSLLLGVMLAACAATAKPPQLQPSSAETRNLSPLERCIVGTWSGTWTGAPGATEVTQLYAFSASGRYFEELLPLTNVRVQHIVHGEWSASEGGLVLASRGARQTLALSLFRRLTAPNTRDPACNEAAFAEAIAASGTEDEGFFR